MRYGADHFPFGGEVLGVFDAFGGRGNSARLTGLDVRKQKNIDRCYKTALNVSLSFWTFCCQRNYLVRLERFFTMLGLVCVVTTEFLRQRPERNIQFGKTSGICVLVRSAKSGVSHWFKSFTLLHLQKLPIAIQLQIESTLPVCFEWVRYETQH